MANKVYVVTLHVTETNLGTVLSALAGSSTLVSVVPTQETASAKPAPPGSPRAPRPGPFYAGGKRNKGIKGEDLILETMGKEDRVYDALELANVFVQRGFARTSVYPQLSLLAKAGRVRSLGNGKFCLPGHLLKLGAAHP
jgi:hypothetical protein